MKRHVEGEADKAASRTMADVGAVTASDGDGAVTIWLQHAQMELNEDNCEFIGSPPSTYEEGDQVFCDVVGEEWFCLGGIGKGVDIGDHTHPMSEIVGLLAAQGVQDADINALESGLATEVIDRAAADSALAAAILTKQDASTAATDSELAAHIVDTTAIHGITDTAQLALLNALNTFTQKQTVSAAGLALALSSSTAAIEFGGDRRLARIGSGLLGVAAIRATDAGGTLSYLEGGRITANSLVEANVGGSSYVAMGWDPDTVTAGASIAFGASLDASLKRIGASEMGTGTGEKFSAYGFDGRSQQAKTFADATAATDLTTKQQMDTAIAAVGSAVTAEMKAFAGRTAPAGYLLCDGTAVSRTTYSALFAAIVPSLGTVTITIAAPGVVTLTGHGLITGDQVYFTTTGALPTGLAANTLYYVINVTANTFRLATSRANADAATAITTTGTQSGVHTIRYCPFGLGDGSTTFNVPDMRDRVAVGGSTTVRLGETGGAKTHTLDITQIPAHTHTYTAPNNYDENKGPTAVPNPLARIPNSFSTGSAGGGLSHNNMQPFAGANWIIKT